eukprot:TRINITY_DN4820_c0_g1_i1.p1 TRINITY_DN4820_c0_g1~~TRINITY_DN4820_c0_g1_i1.p1  ORF type:complete len:429 (-),score=57.31 TRINITY_DN4820_c0_g1_i1:312-1598(-)
MAQNIAVLFADEWGTSAGGIVSFNMTLASNLKRALPDWVIACAVPQKNLIQKDAALKSGVVLISRDPSLPVRHYRHGTDELFDALFLPEGCHPAQVRLVVGHAHITGEHALYHRKTFCNAKYLLFNHVTPEEFSQLKDTLPDAAATMSTVDKLLKLAPQYDIVASVGPRIYANWQTRYQELDERKFTHLNMLPLIPDALMAVSSDPPQFDLDALQVVLCFGRTHEIFAAKGMALASTAYGQLCDLLGTSRVRRLHLKIAGAEPGLYGDLRIKIMATIDSSLRPHIGGVNATDFLKPEQVLAAMKTAAICLMPSLEEPFGLSGMESMAIGKITLISANSGLADFLYDLDRDSYDAFVIPTIASSAEKDLIANGRRWGLKLRDILQDADSYNRYRAKAMRLRDLLRKAQLDTSGKIYGPFFRLKELVIQS